MQCSESSYVEVKKGEVLHLAKSQCAKILAKRAALRSERIDHHLKNRKEWNSWFRRLRPLVPSSWILSESRESVESSIEEATNTFGFYFDDNYASEIAEACDAVAKLCNIAAGETVLLSSYHLNEITKPI